MPSIKCVSVLALGGTALVLKGVIHANHWLRFQRSPATYRGYRK